MIKNGTVVMLVRRRERSELTEFIVNGGEVIPFIPGIVGVVQEFCPFEKEYGVLWTGYENKGLIFVLPNQIIPINNPDIDLGDDTYMEFDTKIKKPVKESA